MKDGRKEGREGNKGGKRVEGGGLEGMRERGREGRREGKGTGKEKRVGLVGPCRGSVNDHSDLYKVSAMTPNAITPAQEGHT